MSDEKVVLPFTQDYVLGLLEEINQLRTERDALRQTLSLCARWKHEMTIVNSDWEKVWEAAGRPGELGETKSQAVLNLLEGR